MSASSGYNYEDTFEQDETETSLEVSHAAAGDVWTDNIYDDDGDTSTDDFDHDDVRTTVASVSSRVHSVVQNQNDSQTVQTTMAATRKHDANENATETEKETLEKRDEPDVTIESGGNAVSETEVNVMSKDEDNLISKDEDNLISRDEDDMVSATADNLSDPSVSRYQEQLKEITSRKVSVSDKLCVDQCYLAGKRVLIRVDYDVPVKDGVVTDNQKIKASLTTIKYVRKKGARCVILMSHLGTPGGRVVPEFSLKPVAVELEKLIKKSVTFVKDCVGPEVVAACLEPRQGSLILLENLRFHIEEEGHGVDGAGNRVQATAFDVDKFRNSLSRLGDVYINDAFSTAHQAQHSSVVGCTLHQRAIGLLMKQEIQNFSQIIGNPKKPLVAIFGGAQFSDKIPLIENLLDFANEIIIAGGISFTFLKVLQGMPFGNSLYDEQGAQIVPRLMEKAKANNVAIHLPVDFVASDQLSEEADVSTCSADDGVPEGMMGLDVGEKSTDLFTNVILRARTIVWYGPPGAYEMAKFADGTRCVMNAVVQATKKGAVSILGGGDTATCAAKFQTEHLVSHISTAGLELLAGKVLPGIDVLSTAPRKRDVDKLKLSQCSLSGKRVMIRTDLDVQVGQDGIINTWKLAAALPTIQFVLNQSPRYVLLLSHLGHPRGRPHHVYSLRPVAKKLETLLGKDVLFMPDCVGPQVEEELAGTSPGAVVLLENVGFHPEEEGVVRKGGEWVKCTTEDVQYFRQSLSRLCDVYINDDFGSAHLPHSSIVGVNVTRTAVSLPCHNDLKMLEDFNQEDKSPYLAIVGGAETAEKLFVMNDLVNEVDELMVVGGMANYFLKISKGLNIRSLLYDKCGADPGVQILDSAAKNGVVIHWPVDFIVGDSQSPEAIVEMMDILETIPDGWLILDIGEQTYSRFKGIITKFKKIVWYGSPGVCEMEIFSTGTKALVNSIGQAVKSGTSVMILGESTVDVWNQFKEQSVECPVNRKGKASLAFLAGIDLPGVAVLDQNPEHKVSFVLMDVLNGAVMLLNCA
ncbi:phosphoglycerate kinase [Bulinus truncatus]|nr:phosphoglycerate kinase [Bulinus truncatus]